MMYHTSESVSAGHPDKIADQISDALLDNFLAFDPMARVACETLVTSGQVFLAGEVSTNTYVDVRKVARGTIEQAGYTDNKYHFCASSCGILSAIHEQSKDIARGVFGVDNARLGAGDQGTMVGYATCETDALMPLGLFVAHTIMEKIFALRQRGILWYLRPDAKCQVSVCYDENHVPQYIDTIVLSTQHEPTNCINSLREKIKADVKKHVMAELVDALPKPVGARYGDIDFIVNPAGIFELGGPHVDTGLTGRKIVVDTYGGFGSHGGGAFSGKDPSKVDRSASYATRHIAKNIVAAGIARRVQVSVSYAIGREEPVSYHVDTYGTSSLRMSDYELGKQVMEMFDMRPAAIIDRLNLRRPIYLETAAHGHMGRPAKEVVKTFSHNGNSVRKRVMLFTWERTDHVDRLQRLRDG